MSEFKDLHKTSHKIAQLKELQGARRLAFLEEQKQRREEQFSFLRDLKKIVPNLKLTKKQLKNLVPVNNEKQHPRANRFNYKFKNILMLSEWMMESPKDLDEYLLIPCPKGVRISLVLGERQSSNTCEAYYKNGMHFFDIKTNLPHDTILDCVFYKGTKTIYVLDVLMYAGRDLVNCDTEFRRFWLKSKFAEDNLQSFSQDIKLKIIDDFDFSNSHVVYECFQKYPTFDDGALLDGFLFYHKKSSYTFGTTPLVLWLFAFMIDEVLTMFRAHPKHHYDKPLKYTNYLDYINEFNEKMTSKKNKSSQKERMDCEATGFAKEVTKDDAKEDEDFTADDELEKMIELEKFGGDV